MPTVLSCVICSENYKNTDEVCSTLCGHIFHMQCLEQWRGRSVSCPQCRQDNPQSHKIYLNYEDGPENDQNLLQLKSQLEQTQLNGSQLQLQLDESERNFMGMQEQFNTKDGEVKELRIKVQELNEQLQSQTEESENHSSILQSRLTESERDFLFLNGQFNEKEEEVKSLKIEIQDLQLKFEDSQENTCRSQFEYARLEGDISDLQVKCTTKEEEIEKLNQQNKELTFQLKSHKEENQIYISNLQSKLTESERNFLHLQLQLQKSEEQRQENDKPTTALDSRVGKKKTPNSDNMGEVIMLREQMKVLKEKLKRTSLELDKEIKNSSELTFEKMKLQSMLSQFTSGPVTPSPPIYSNMPLNVMDFKNHNLTPQQIPSNMPTNAMFLKNQSLTPQPIYPNVPQNRLYNSMILQHQNIEKENTKLVKKLPISQMANEKGADITSVVIRGVSTNDATMNTVSFVLKLARLMDLLFTEADVERVFLLERQIHVRRNIQPEKSSLVVKFKTLELKVMFLTHKEKLNQYPETKELVLYEFVSDGANTLFHYAKELKQFGYKFVYCRNNAVFVKKNTNSTATRIFSTQQVDTMKVPSMDDKRVVAPVQVCDDQFYSLC